MNHKEVEEWKSRLQRHMVGVEDDRLQEQVSNDGIIYECKSWPDTPRCGQQGYTPFVNYDDKSLWEDACE